MTIDELLSQPCENCRDAWQRETLIRHGWDEGDCPECEGTKLKQAFYRDELLEALGREKE